MKRANIHKEGQRPLKLFIELLLAILVVETLVMLLLHLFIEPLHLSATAEGLLDSFSLLIFLFPILYLLFYRPLSLEIAGYKQAQKDILESNAINQSLIQTIPFGMDIVNEEGNILYLSPRLETALGEEAIGKKCWQLYRDDKQQCRDCPLRKEIVPGKTASIETDGVLGGRSFQINHSGMIYQGKKAVLEIFQDISERKEAEGEMIRLNKELLELDRMKSEFINMASHELRTPIAIMREGISQVVEGLRGEMPAQQKRFLSISLSNIDRLIKIVDSIFDISEIEYSRGELDRELTDITALARETIANFSQQAKDKGLEIKQGFPGKKIELDIDKARIKQVFANLISNAFDFTDQGSIEISIQEKDAIIECSVSDTGRGIPEALLPGIFGKFQQSGKSYGPGAKGVGLGLAIAKAIVERHKGRIWVESKPQEGTRFIFVLPR